MRFPIIPWKTLSIYIYYRVVMPTKSTKDKSLIKLGGSQMVALPPDWLKYWEKHFKKYGKKVQVYGNSLLVIVPTNRPDLEAKARKIVEGRD